VIPCLWELKKTYGRQFDQFRHLGLAFAFVYGQAKGETIRADWMDWVAAGRPVPSCSESFGYYLQHQGEMLYALDILPWPLLLHIADNDVPMAEREWALRHYRDRSLESLGRIHSDPKYITGDRARTYTEVSGAMAIPAILQRGGVCSQQAYYASGVFKCLGVPSVRLLERWHAYEGWLAGERPYHVLYGGTGGRKNGYFLCPLTRKRKIQYEFAMLAAAMNLSYERYRNSLAACHIFLLQAEKAHYLTLLNQALEENPYCTEAWKLLADACREGWIRPEEGWEVYHRIRKQLS